MDEVAIKALVAEEVRRQLREVFEELYRADMPDLEMLRALYHVERDQGKIHTGPLALRIYVSTDTAHRRIGELCGAGWLEPIRPRTGRGARKAAGWKLSQKARFAVMLERMVA